MDIFRFNNPLHPLKMEQGQIVDSLKSKLWVERYLQNGEFQIGAKISSGAREKLPIGSFISHVDTDEIMIVENHAVSEKKGEEPEISITGRGFETYFDQRIVGSNKPFPVSGEVSDYLLTSGNTWNQAIALLNDHILATSLIDDDNAIPYTTPMANVTGSGVPVTRIVTRGSLYARLLELLAIDDLGIKIVRPSSRSPLEPGSLNTAVVIHKGTDRSASVIFSYDSGEIDSADYLWSNQRAKNCALVTGKWVETFVDTPASEYARRMMYVEAKDVDESFETTPTGTDLTNVIAVMQRRGLEAIAAQKDIVLTKAEVSKESTRAVYRKDFFVGDIVTVSGDYNQTRKMRVSEFVEAEDETGTHRYPTLTLV